MGIAAAVCSGVAILLLLILLYIRMRRRKRHAQMLMEKPVSDEPQKMNSQDERDIEKAGVKQSRQLSEQVRPSIR
jgi:hypothetical protein